MSYWDEIPTYPWLAGPNPRRPKGKCYPDRPDPLDRMGHTWHVVGQEESDEGPYSIQECQVCEKRRYRPITNE